jgi:hypothetical protein
MPRVNQGKYKKYIQEYNQIVAKASELRRAKENVDAAISIVDHFDDVEEIYVDAKSLMANINCMLDGDKFEQVETQIKYKKMVHDLERIISKCESIAIENYDDLDFSPKEMEWLRQYEIYQQVIFPSQY